MLIRQGYNVVDQYEKDGIWYMVLQTKNSKIQIDSCGRTFVLDQND